LGQSSGNIGLLMRQRYTVYDPCASVAAIASTNASAHTLNLLPIRSYKEYVAKSYYRASWGWEWELDMYNTLFWLPFILNTYIHFFDRIPLLKGVYMKMTMNLNNASATIETNAMAAANISTGANAT
jgi:hypothetical protein